MNAMIENSIIYGFITIFSFGLFIVSILSYRKTHNQKLLFVTGVFLLFFIKSIMLSSSLFFSQISSLLDQPILAIFDLLMLALLFIATLK